MQLMIDTQADPTHSLRRIAALIITEADVRDAEDTPAGSPAIRPNTLRVPELAAAGESAPNVDTAAIFKKPDAAPVSLPLVAPSPPVAAAPAAAIAPPPPVAPPASAGPAASSAGPVERDSSGLPYDVRIHQATRGKKTDGTWKLKKGLDPAIATAVTVELRGATASGVAGPALAPPPPSMVAPPPPASAVAPQPGPVASGPAPVPSGDTPVTAFRKLMQVITANTNTGKLTNDEVDAALKSVDLPPRQLISLVQNPDKVAGVAAYVEAVLAAKA